MAERVVYKPCLFPQVAMKLSVIVVLLGLAAADTHGSTADSILARETDQNEKEYADAFQGLQTYEGVLHTARELLAAKQESYRAGDEAFAPFPALLKNYFATAQGSLVEEQARDALLGIRAAQGEWEGQEESYHEALSEVDRIIGDYNHEIAQLYAQESADHQD